MIFGQFIEEGEKVNKSQAILQAASQTFSLFGYKATTMDQVARTANVGKGTIYNFYATKEILFQAVVMELISSMRKTVEKEMKPHISFEKNALNALNRLLQFRETHALYVKLVAEEKELRTPAVQSMLTKIEQEITRILAEKIQLAMNKGEIIQCDPELVSYLLLKSYIAMIVDWQDTHLNKLAEDTISQLFQSTIFKGLMP